MGDRGRRNRLMEKGWKTGREGLREGDTSWRGDGWMAEGQDSLQREGEGEGGGPEGGREGGWVDECEGGRAL